MKALKNLLEIEKEATTRISNAKKEKGNLFKKAEKESLAYEEDNLKILNDEVSLMEKETEAELQEMDKKHKEQIKELKESLSKNIDKKVDEAFKFLLEVIFK